MIEKLLTYQEIDKELKSLENTLNSSEEKKQYAIAYKFLSTVGDVVAKLDAKAEDLLNKFNAVIEKQKELSERLAYINSEIEGSETEEDASYMLKKADEILNSIKGLEDTLKKITISMEEVKAEYAKVGTNTKRAQAQYKEYGEKYNNLKKELEPKVKEVKAKLDALKKGIDPVLMAKYDEKRKDKNFPILTPLAGKKCASCGMELSMKAIADLENGNVIECENCRLLVYKK